MKKILVISVWYLAALVAVNSLFLLSGCGRCGPAGSQGASGATGASGSQGAKGDTGTQGVAGSNGKDGAAGKDGANGKDGSTVTPIRFCGGSDSTYPSSFTEYGLCINNELWAVYSANDGFMTKIPPGTYYSNGINSSCTFTVGTNCQVSR